MSKRSRQLNPGFDQLIGRYKFRALTPTHMPVAEIVLSFWYRCSIRKYEDAPGGQSRLRWAFKTRSQRDQFLHRFKDAGAIKA